MTHRILLFVFVLTWGSVLLGQSGPDGDVDRPALDPTKVATQLAEARAKLENLPPTTAPDSPDALLRKAWERRVLLLEDAVRLLASAAAQMPIPQQIVDRRRSLAERGAELDGDPVSAPVDPPTDQGLAELGVRVAAQRDRVAALRTVDTEKAAYVDKMPSLLADSGERQRAALESATRLAQESAAATEPAQKELLGLRAQNSNLDAEVARLQTRVLDRDLEEEKLLAPLRLDEGELAGRRLERMEEQYRLYAAALERAIDQDATIQDSEEKRLEVVVEAAKGQPADLFVATKQLEMVRFKKRERAHRKFMLSLQSDHEEQQRRLADESGELVSLREYVKQAGGGTQAGERIKFTLRRMKSRRQALERTLRRNIAAELSEKRARRLELEDKIFVLKESWDQEIESSAAELSGPEASKFRADAASLFEPYRTALRGERDLINDGISAGQKLQLALIQRRKALDEIEGFIRSQVFWLRDAKPLGTEVWDRAVKEAGVVSAWARALRSPETLDRLIAGAKRPEVLAMALLLLLALPIGLFWVRQRLRRIVKKLNDRTVEDDARILDRVLAVATGIVSVALLPGYVFIASRLMTASEPPGSTILVVSSLLGHLAIFLFFLFLSASFFAGRGTAQVQFGLGREASHDLHRSLCFGLTGYLVFYVAGSVLSRSPFLLDTQPLEALPRIAHTLFLAVVVTAGILLLQPRSAFSRCWAATLGNNFFGRRWPIISTLLCAAGLGLIALEVAGYRYGAGVLGSSLAQSLCLLLLLVPLYKGLVFAIESISRQRRARRSLANLGEDHGSREGAEALTPAEELTHSVEENGQELQLAKFFRVFFFIGGAVLIARIWGIDEQTFSTLDRIKLYDLTDTGEDDLFVSWGHVLRAAFYTLGTYYLLKYLPGIYEYTIFPRLNLDTGLKYAILTMSRYGVFTAGAILTLTAIQLDFGRLQWLMAAIGVGLGFGLQEIVSNFVSGIILLVERPVRVGDVVTVGTTSGKVQRINIRATTVVNFDRQEIIVPNRSLITKEVTNWTRGDTILRLVVPIGVAYGSDVDQVTELLLRIAREHFNVMRDPGPQAIFLSHGESSLDFELRVFVPDPSLKMPVLHHLNSTINRELDALGIEIPFPQRDLHIRSSAVPWPAGSQDERESDRSVQS